MGCRRLRRRRRRYRRRATSSVRGVFFTSAAARAAYNHMRVRAQVVLYDLGDRAAAGAAAAASIRVA